MSESKILYEHVLAFAMDVVGGHVGVPSTCPDMTWGSGCYVNAMNRFAPFLIGGILIGLLCGRQILLPAEIGFVVAVTALGMCAVLRYCGVISTRMARSCSLAILGLCWGVLRSFPIPAKSLPRARVERALLGDEANGVLIVESGGSRFTVQGRARVGDVGRVAVSPSVTPWERTRARWEPRPGNQFGLEEEPLEIWAISVWARQILLDRIAQHGSALTPWLQSIVLGSMASLPTDLLEAFKLAGVFHVLAVSGQHMSFLGVLVLSALIIPLQILYAGLLFPARRWPAIYAAFRILSVGIIAVYACVVGLPASAIRAALIFMVAQASLAIWGRPSYVGILYGVLLLQLLVYPEGFLVTGNLLSWASYLLVVAFGVAPTGGPILKLRQMLLLQVSLSCVIAVGLGALSLMGIVANMFLVPLFTVAFFMAIVSLAWPTEMLIGVSEWCQWRYIGLVEWCGDICRQWTWLYVDLNEKAPHVRMGLLVMLVYFLLKAWMRLNEREQSL